jgi:hypothetical protein
MKLLADAGKLPSLGMAFRGQSAMKAGTGVPTEKPTHALGDATQHRLQRDGARDLVFRGWKLGSGSVVSGKFDSELDGGTYERETEVSLYLTEGGNFVIQEVRIRSFGDQRNDDVTTVPIKGDPMQSIAVAGERNEGGAVPVKMVPASKFSAEERLLLRLKESGMGPASRDAWNEACKVYEPLRAFETESLD